MPFSGLLFVCLPFRPKRAFPADKHILRYVFVVLNRLDDGLLFYSSKPFLDTTLELYK